MWKEWCLGTIKKKIMKWLTVLTSNWLDDAISQKASLSLKVHMEHDSTLNGDLKNFYYPHEINPIVCQRRIFENILLVDETRKREEPGLADVCQC